MVLKWVIMMKYIIEIEDMPLGLYDKDTNTILPRELYRVKGFDKLIFDQEDLDKLQVFDSDLAYNKAHEEGYLDGYQQGLKKAWDTAKRMSELESCPFCGSTDIYKTFEPGYIDDSAIIFCNSCKISVKLEENDQEGYNDKTIAKAVDAWNRRVYEK